MKTSKESLSEKPVEVKSLLELNHIPSNYDKFQVDDCNIDEGPNEEEMLNSVRSFGRYQYFQFFLLGLLNIIIKVHNTNYIFAASEVDYRCVVPECETNNTILRPLWWPNKTDHRCSRPFLNQDFKTTEVCSVEDFSNTSISCDRWIYENDHSIVHAFDMACKPWMRTSVGTIHNLGHFIANPLFGYLSDRYGRKLSLIVGILGITGCGLMKTFSVNYFMYMSLEFMEATFGGNTYMILFVLAVELGNKKTRPLISMLFSCFTMITRIIFTFIVKAFPYWKSWIRITYGPGLLVLLYIFILSESLRWMIVNGKVKMAKQTVLKMSKWNRVTVDTEKLRRFDNYVLRNDEKNSEHIPSIFHSPIILRRVAIISFCWAAIAFIYYGLMINSVALPGSKYTNFMLSSVATFSGDVWAPFALNYFGRKKTCLAGFILCGACCIATGSVPESMSWLALVTFLLGTSTASATFSGIYLFTSELFPTTMRSSFIGFCSMIARVGSAVAPQTPLLMSVLPSLHLIIFGSISLLAAVLVTLTPETLNKELPDTMQEAEEISKKPR